jgi:YebC/PmpR family DNA-binding regulatory protein
MSGHSKWSQIKHQKGTADQKRARIFSKLTKAITVAARGGENPDFNVRLRLAIEQAKKNNMPKDNIERAIAKGAGKDADSKALEEILYEGFGPDRVALLIETITDNHNRASSSLKATLNKYSGSLAGSNSVQWMFEKKDVFVIEASEAHELAAIEAGADDVIKNDNQLRIIVTPTKSKKFKEKLTASGISILKETLEYIPTNTTNISKDAQHSLAKLCEELSENEDVHAIYTNVTA